MPEGIDVARFGEQLRRVRQKRGKTLEDVSNETNVTIPTISRIERGAAKELRSGTLLALSAWMGASPENFQDNPPTVAHRGKPQETPDIVELHLRADKRLDKQTATTLARMFRAAYDELSKRNPKG
jgi:transcriptional regulator with XRE-family HTH domain